MKYFVARSPENDEWYVVKETRQIGESFIVATASNESMAKEIASALSAYGMTQLRDTTC